MDGDPDGCEKAEIQGKTDSGVAPRWLFVKNGRSAPLVFAYGAHTSCVGCRTAAIPEAMPSRAPAKSVLEFDQRVCLHGVSWAHYETLLSIRGAHEGVRITYLDGELELMEPSKRRKALRKTIDQLLQAYASEDGLELIAYGSERVAVKSKKVGVEPDAWYLYGGHDGTAPDLAIEVAWTPGGTDMLKLYGKLGVPEVWIWENGRISVHSRSAKSYVRGTRSRVLPELDIVSLARCLEQPTPAKAAAAFRATPRKRR